MDQFNSVFTLRRTAGVLLHITSLPSGDLGDDALRFAEYIKAAGQSAWQIMPLGPPGPGNSPYTARSAFAGNPALISLDRLAGEGLLDQSEIARARPGDLAVDEGSREQMLRAAFERFRASGSGSEDLDAFEGRDWVRPFALWMALRTRYDCPWWEWPAPHRDSRDAMAAIDDDLRGEMRFHAFVQFVFERQWQRVRDHVRWLGVTLVGDLPIFVDRDSADAWSNPALFKFGADLEPRVVAGVPPDVFSETGQRWGNPPYDWAANRAAGYSWWISRIRRTFELVDIVRLDHFRGFQAAWEIPAESQTAVEGAWVDGPGLELFAYLEAVVGKGRFIVEDLGIITDEVRLLRRVLGYPGMAVLQFAFSDRYDTFLNPHLPHNHERRLVVYTGTHDNDTTAGWFGRLGELERNNLARYLGRMPSGPAEATDDLIRLCYSSPAQTAIVPLQDILQLGSEGRMNVPGVPDGNWLWRFSWDQVHPERTAWLRDLAETYGR
jgi:4-alpha-glucanotransferase